MWKRLFQKSHTPKATPLTARPLPVGFKQTILHATRSRSIPPLPESAQRLFLVVTDPSSEAFDFVQAIEGDEGLASRIMKIANSVYFDRGAGSKSVVEAVATIGTAELRNILSATTLGALFPFSHPLRDKLWEHNLSVAIFSRELAARTAPGRENEAFLGGLLHDVGKLLLLDLDRNQYEKITQEAGKNGSFCTEEESVYPFNHCEVGQFLAEQWQFSEDLRSAIRFHHEPLEVLTSPSLPLIIQAADLISHKHRIGFGNTLTTLQNNAALKMLEALEALRLNGDSAGALIKELPKIFAEEKERFLVS